MPINPKIRYRVVFIGHLLGYQTPLPMEFTKTYHELKGIFSLTNGDIQLNGHEFAFRPVPFSSNSKPIPYTRTGIYNESNGHSFAVEDTKVEENIHFNFPVYLPNSSSKYNKAIVLLHGLNERSWHKYLPWAHYLGQRTNRPIILFPLAFHMNRGHDSWSNPRLMMPHLTNRKLNKDISMATFANTALSHRLSDDPLRFFTSGKQSADDLIQLLESINEGSIPFLEKGAQVDFFSYSIGSFLAQILFLANPNEVVSHSKLFIFCGGSLFSEMNGTSRLIMDSHAFGSLRKYYINDFLSEVKRQSPLSSFIKEGVWGESFISMISEENNRFNREYKLQRLRDQIRIFSLKKDAVIPSSAMQSAFACIRNRDKDMITELDFPFEYSHESPFPVFSTPKSAEVDRAFNQVFSKAAEFLY